MKHLMNYNSFFLQRICWLLCLTSCKLQPVYSEKYLQDNGSNLCAVEIESIPSIAGAELYQYLSELIPYCGVTKYRLTVNLSYLNSSGIIKRNSDVSREITTQLVQYKLLDMQNQQVVTSGQFNNISSYNTATSPYTTYIESESILETMALQAAEEVRTRLILFFDELKRV
jgi:hypothetical protein